MGFKDGFKRACGTVKDAACGFADTVKQEFKKGQLKNELEELYETLGQIRYNEILNGNEASEETIKIFEEISRIKAELDALDVSVNNEKDENKCAFCGKKLPTDVTYCPYCGEKTKIEE